MDREFGSVDRKALIEYLRASPFVWSLINRIADDELDKKSGLSHYTIRAWKSVRNNTYDLDSTDAGTPLARTALTFLFKQMAEQLSSDESRIDNDANVRKSIAHLLDDSSDQIRISEVTAPARLSDVLDRQYWAILRHPRVKEGVPNAEEFVDRIFGTTPSSTGTTSSDGNAGGSEDHPRIPIPPGLVGRDTVYRDVIDVLESGIHPIVVVAGQPGAGKTRLAELAFGSAQRRLGDRFPKGSPSIVTAGLWLTEVDTTADLVVQRLISSLVAGRKKSEFPASRFPRTLDELGEAFADRLRLIFIDNVDQVKDIDQLFQRLCQLRVTCPDLSVLCTVRRHGIFPHSGTYEVLQVGGWIDDAGQSADAMCETLFTSKAPGVPYSDGIKQACRDAGRLPGCVKLLANIAGMQKGEETVGAVIAQAVVKESDPPVYDGASTKMAKLIAAGIDHVDSSMKQVLLTCICFDGRFPRDVAIDLAVKLFHKKRRDSAPLSKAEAETAFDQLQGTLGMIRPADSSVGSPLFSVYPPAEEALYAQATSLRRRFNTALADLTHELCGALVDECGQLVENDGGNHEYEVARTKALNLEDTLRSMEQRHVANQEHLEAVRVRLLSYRHAVRDKSLGAWQPTVDLQWSQIQPGHDLNLDLHLIALFTLAIKVQIAIGPYKHAKQWVKPLRIAVDSVRAKQDEWQSDSEQIERLIIHAHSEIANLGRQSIDAVAAWTDADGGSSGTFEELVESLYQTPLHLCNEFRWWSTNVEEYVDLLMSATLAYERLHPRKIPSPDSVMSEDIPLATLPGGETGPLRVALQKFAEESSDLFTSARAFNGEGLFLLREGKLDASLKNVNKARAKFAGYFETHDDETRKLQWLGGTWTNLALSYIDAGDWQSAKKALAEGEKYFRDGGIFEWLGVNLTARLAMDLYQGLPEQQTGMPPWSHQDAELSTVAQTVINSYTDSDLFNLQAEMDYGETLAWLNATVGEAYIYQGNLRMGTEKLQAAAEIIRKEHLYHMERAFRVHWLLAEIAARNSDAKSFDNHVTCARQFVQLRDTAERVSLTRYIVAKQRFDELVEEHRGQNNSSTVKGDG